MRLIAAAFALSFAPAAIAAPKITADLKAMSLEQLRANFCVYEGSLYDEGAEICISARRLVRCVAQGQQVSRRLQWVGLDAAGCDKSGASRASR
jgi:hypothetical protein